MQVTRDRPNLNLHQIIPVSSSSASITTHFPTISFLIPDSFNWRVIFAIRSKVSWNFSIEHLVSPPCPCHHVRQRELL